MPAILADTLDQARCWQEVQHTIARLRRDEAPQTGHFRIVQTLTELPGWPDDLTLRYYDGTTFYPIGDLADTRLLDLQKTDFANDGWTDRVLSGLSTSEQRALLGQSSVGLPAVQRNRLLAGRWAQYLEHNTKRLTTAMARSATLDPIAAPLLKAFPGLPESIANELVGQVVGQDRVRLLEGRVSKGLGIQCAEALRELRLARALRALEVGENSVDRDRLILGLVGNDPLLQGRVRLRLYLRESKASMETVGAGPLKIIRQQGEQYRAFDDKGNELADTPILEEALLRAMPDDARQALGLEIWEADKFRSRLMVQALGDRQGLRAYLRMKRFDSAGPPLQWLNGRLGYPLSGRGRLPMAEWRGILGHRLERLYPSYAGDDLVELQATFTQQASDEQISLENLVTRLETDWNRLDSELHQWVEHQGIHHPAENAYEHATVMTVRRSVERQIRRAWRRERDPGRSGNLISLRLHGHDIGRLPPLSVRFDHIDELNLADMGLDADPSPFLRLFPSLDALYLQGNNLSAVPVAVGELPVLMELSLSNNPLSVDAGLLAPLQAEDAAPLLSSLHLSGIGSRGDAQASTHLVAAINRLAQRAVLNELVWSGNVHFTSAELQAIGAMPHLKILDLTDCDLILNQQGSAFLRTATALEDLRLSGNHCRQLPALPELTALQQLEMANSGLERLPPPALAVLSRPTADTIVLDLSGNRIRSIQDDLLPALARTPRDILVGLLLDDNPLPSAQIDALRALAPEAFRYTVDDWLYDSPGVQRAMEIARDDAGNRGFLDWLSGAMREVDDTGTLTDVQREQGVAVLRRYVRYQHVYDNLAAPLPDFDVQLAELRRRLQARALDRVRPDLNELQLHFSMFESIQRSRVPAQTPPFSAFLDEHVHYWDFILRQRHPDEADRLPMFTREGFINWLCDAQETFNPLDHEPRPGEMTWRPYLGVMSTEWTNEVAIWNRVEDDLADALGETITVDPSGWPQVLLDNLTNPDVNLPSAWESIQVDGNTVWHRAGLEAVSDVDWRAGRSVVLNDDQYRRTMAILRSVMTREIEALARRVTTQLVVPWWPVAPQ